MSSEKTPGQQVDAIVAAAQTWAQEIEAEAHRDAEAHVARAAKAAEAIEAAAADLQRQIQELVARVAALGNELQAPGAAEPELVVAPEPAAISPFPDPTPPPEPPRPPEPAAEPESEPEPAAAAPKTKTAAPEGARLIALNMALSGTPREETARYLRENYDLDDADGLLDDVYAKAGS